MSVVTDNMVLFWRETDFMSNFYRCKNAFPVLELEDSPLFTNSEAVFMLYKAIEFDDDQAVHDIIKVRHNALDCKKIGRRIKFFNDADWANVREERMFNACLSKFAYNNDLAERLLATGDKILVEASPYDRVWGIGLAEGDSRALDPTKWVGLNLLGKVLMRVRNILRMEKTINELLNTNSDLV